MSPDNMKIVPERDETAPSRVVRKSSAGNVGSAVAWLSLVGIIALGGVGFYKYTELLALSVQQSDLLQKATQRIQVLENELVQTGRDLSQSGSTLEKRVADSEHEIRKLWDLSNKRNKVDIAKNEADLNQLQKSVAGLEKRQKDAAEEISALARTLNSADSKLQAEIRSAGSSLAAMSDRLSKVETASQQARKELERLNAASESSNVIQEQAQLREKLAVLEKSLAGIDAEAIQNVQLVLSVYDERLDAIDASRRQLTSNVTRLNTDVNNLQLEMRDLSQQGGKSTGPAAQ